MIRKLVPIVATSPSSPRFAAPPPTRRPRPPRPAHRLHDDRGEVTVGYVDDLTRRLGERGLPLGADVARRRWRRRCPDSRARARSTRPRRRPSAGCSRRPTRCRPSIDALGTPSTGDGKKARSRSDQLTDELGDLSDSIQTLLDDPGSNPVQTRARSPRSDPTSGKAVSEVQDTATALKGLKPNGAFETRSRPSRPASSSSAPVARDRRRAGRVPVGQGVVCGDAWFAPWKRRPSRRRPGAPHRPRPLRRRSANRRCCARTLRAVADRTRDHR